MNRKPGFIAPPWPHVRGDSVRASGIVDRIQYEANRGCGLYYEIYYHRALSALMNVLVQLNDSDAEVFRHAAMTGGFPLDNATLNESRQAYHDLMAQIREEQI